MTRCRDIWIERSKWFCSVALMSAFGAAVFGVTGADGNAGSGWGVAHPARTHAKAHVVRIHSTAAPQASLHKATHTGSFSSHVTVTHRSRTRSRWSAAAPVAKAVPQTGATSPAGSATNAGHVAAKHSRHAATHASHATHATHATHKASKHVRFAAQDNFNAPASTSTPDSAAVSAALGAWTGADVEVTTTTDTTPTTTDTTPTTTDTTPTTTDTTPTTTDTTPTTTCPSDPTGDTGTGDTGDQSGDGSGQATSTDPSDPTATGTTDGTGCPTTGNNGQQDTVPGTGITDQGTAASSTSGAVAGVCPSGAVASGQIGVDQGNDSHGSYMPGGDDSQGGDTTTTTTDPGDANGATDQTPAVSTTCGTGGGSTPGGGPVTSPAPASGTSDDGSQVGGTSSLGIVSPTSNGDTGNTGLVTQPTTGTTLPTTGTTAPTTGTGTTGSGTGTTGTGTGTGTTGTGTGNPTSGPAGFSSITGGIVTGGLGGGARRVAAGTGAATGAAGGAGLGALTPATAQVGLTTAAKTTHKATHKSASNGSKTRTPQRSESAPQAILKVVNRIPESVWIALAALAAVAATALGVAYRSNRRVRAQRGEMAAVSAAALTDPLTGVLNRRGFTEAVERELARARRYDRPFVLAYVDVRGLKGVNDSEGHLAGDELLKGVAALLHDSARADDVVGRLGGDELGILLPEQSGEGAAAVTNRIQSMLPERRAEMGLGSPWGLTIGTASYPEDGETYDELIATADRRLYEQRGIELRRS
jgi:diguanylate cyclase (GGDEF)-like protein